MSPPKNDRVPWGPVSDGSERGTDENNSLYSLRLFSWEQVSDRSLEGKKEKRRYCSFILRPIAPRENGGNLIDKAASSSSLRGILFKDEIKQIKYAA